MSKFKVGDKVRRVVKDYDSQMKVGHEGVVTGVSNNGRWMSVDYFATEIDPFPLNVDTFELIEEPKMTQQFKAIKIRIKDEQHSRLVQETLFEMGYGWPNKQVGYTSSPWLTTYEDGRLYYGEEMITFDSHENEEVEIVTTYSFKPVDQEVLRKRKEKEALEKNVAEMQKQLDEIKQKLENM